MTAILALTLMLVATGQGSRPAPSTTGSTQIRGKFATVRDREVLASLLASMAADEEFPAPSMPERKEMVLHRRTPKVVEPIISAPQVNYETGGRIMPKDAWDDLERRNVVRLDPNARQISYENLQFPAGILVGNVFPGPESTFVGKTFEEVFPHARGWLEAYVPGYSKDGKTAVVRGRVGPVEKKAMFTAILEQRAGKWMVTWRRYCVYS